MSEIINLGDYVENYRIIIDGENPHAELLKKRGDASRTGDIKTYLEVQAELEKLGFPKVSQDAIQRVRNNVKKGKNNE
jgi:hypothetical protein